MSRCTRFRCRKTACGLKCHDTRSTAWTLKRRTDGGLLSSRETTWRCLRTEKLQRLGFRSGNGTSARVLAISAARAAASSLGGGGPDSLLARAFKTCGGMLPALTGTGSKPPAVSTVLPLLRKFRHFSARARSVRARTHRRQKLTKSSYRYYRCDKH